MKVIVLLLLVATQLHVSTAGDINQPEEAFTYAANYNTGLQQAKADGKPLIVFFHLRTCHACTDLFEDLLKPENLPTRTLAKQFVIVHSLNGSDKQLDNFGPSGNDYYPRFFFVDRNGKLIPGIDAGRTDYPYFYGNAQSLHKSMNDVLNGGKY